MIPALQVRSSIGSLIRIVDLSLRFVLKSVFSFIATVLSVLTALFILLIMSPVLAVRRGSFTLRFIQRDVISKVISIGNL